jgi:zinc-ribbon domain
MSACSTCGNPLAGGARFCPNCGTAVQSGDTQRAALPPHETGSVPVQYSLAEPRFFGVTPATLLFGLAVAAVVLAVVFFATGHWPLGLVLVGVALLSLAGFLEVARRKPDAAVARATGEALWTLRQRAEAVLETLSARSQASAQLRALRRELDELSAVRRDRLLALGDATYRDDHATAEAIRLEVRRLDERAGAVEAETARVVAAAEARVRQARIEVQPTEMVDIPEPYPPPDEGTPPTPAPVPEPYPPPDEGTPPGPIIVPDPGEDDNQQT